MVQYGITEINMSLSVNPVKRALDYGLSVRFVSLGSHCAKPD